MDWVCQHNIYRGLCNDCPPQIISYFRKTMDWSTNPIKLRRAIDALPKDATEEQIKAEYVRIGGGLAHTEVVATEHIVTKEEVTMPVVKPKRTYAKKAKELVKKVKKTIKKK